MKSLILISLLLSTLSYANAKEADEWKLKRFNIYFENDFAHDGEDNQYSSGEKFGLIYKIPNKDNFTHNIFASGNSNVDSYINFSFVNQIFTPANLDTTELIVDDRPYAGWTFLEAGIHTSSKDVLKSLYLQVGTIGPNSKTEEIQKKIHEIVGAHEPMGWDNQLNNEIGINLRYIQKWRYTKDFDNGLETAFIPFVEADLGNISIQGTGGFATRIGWNIQKDFGMSTINTGGETGIPIYQENPSSTSKWGFSFNINGSGSVIGRDIFLDGNTFSDSHSVDKYTLVLNLGLGFSVVYDKFALDYIYQKYTRTYEGEDVRHGFGSLIASWIF